MARSGSELDEDKRKSKMIRLGTYDTFASVGSSRSSGANLNVDETFTLSVKGHNIRGGDATKKYATFTIIATSGDGVVISVEHRHSDFVRLHKAIEGTLPSAQLPQLPKTRTFGRLNTSYLHEKGLTMQAFLRAMQKVDSISSCLAWIDFFSTSDNTARDEASVSVAS